MIVTVVCPGPSAREMLSRRTYAPSYVIAVNGGCEIAAHDTWVVGDGEALQRYKASPRVALLHQFTDWRDHLSDHNRQWADQVAVMHWDALRCAEARPYGGPWHWSDQAAVALAAHLGAHEIEMYGADYAGPDPCPNTEPQRPDRWARQIADLDRIAAWVGVPITRILPGGNMLHAPMDRQATPIHRGRGRLPLGAQLERDAAPAATVKDGVITCPTCSSAMRVYKTDRTESGCVRYVICIKGGHKHTLRGCLV